MTNQEAFTKMVLHLRKQGCKSQKRGTYTCLYRGAEGRMCAVGCLIPDHQYSYELEYRSALQIFGKVPALYELRPELLSDMQMVHDNCPIECWETEFKEVAKKHNLTLPPLEASHA